MKWFYLIVILGLLASCGHHRDVRPNSCGIHRVVVTSDDEEGGQRNAINQANHFCEERYEKVAAVETEKTKYIGDMDEENYRATKRTAKVLQQGGTSAWVFGGKKEKNAGRVASGAGSLLNTATGKGYRTMMTFKCI
ncbi:MAG: hypothetical protein HRT44_13520 [Bdellovibrionales bacterium]|nr:hypothetical protein [Bdellovibrionales bacterium]NQZ20258.1 hypothetical protein [Bdellovibrionales bacterium]